MNKTRLWKLLSLALAVTLLLAAAGCGGKNAEDTAPDQTQTMDEPQTPEESADDSALPDTDAVCLLPTENMFTAMDTVDLAGNAVDSSFFGDHTLTVVNVWNVGCAPCIEEIPVLDRLDKEYAGRGVAVVGLIYDLEAGLSDDSRAEAEEILADAGAEYLQIVASEAMDQSQELQGLVGFPTTFFVDTDGQIRNTTLGARDYVSWNNLIKSALRDIESA